jgi:hypothetical protein
MTRQDHATAALLAWQSLRALPPDQRIEALMADYFLSEEDSAYENVMRRVTEEMNSAL